MTETILVLSKKTFLDDLVPQCKIYSFEIVYWGLGMLEIGGDKYIRFTYRV